jgi:hypothetical protein
MTLYRIQKLQNQNGMTYEPIRTWFVEGTLEDAQNSADADAGQELDWDERHDEAAQGTIPEGHPTEWPDFIWDILEDDGDAVGSAMGRNE